jgi:hypothetical protein
MKHLRAIALFSSFAMTPIALGYGITKLAIIISENL